MDNTFDKLFYDRGELIGGVDEAGVSDIAGPLIAACVILPKMDDPHKHDLRIFQINDSKKIPVRFRKEYAAVIWEGAVAIGIGEVSPNEIDYLGKTASVSVAHLRAIAACKQVGTKQIVRPDFLIVDGKHPINTPIPQETRKKADEKSLCVAAASVVAKVYRDEVMAELHEEFPHYNWISNKGFATDDHYEGLDKHGIVPGIHRIRFFPFVANHRMPSMQDPSTRTFWAKRRRQWREVTEMKMSQNLGEGVACNTKRKFYKHSKNSKKPQKTKTETLDPSGKRSEKPSKTQKTSLNSSECTEKSSSLLQEKEKSSPHPLKLK